eukprot:scaffold1903_cov396-Prasinococcus_capsulatus_cf.AAC.11
MPSSGTRAKNVYRRYNRVGGLRCRALWATCPISASCAVDVKTANPLRLQPRPLLTTSWPSGEAPGGPSFVTPISFLLAPAVSAAETSAAMEGMYFRQARVREAASG